VVGATSEVNQSIKKFLTWLKQQ